MFFVSKCFFHGWEVLDSIMRVIELTGSCQGLITCRSELVDKKSRPEVKFQLIFGKIHIKVLDLL